MRFYHSIIFFAIVLISCDETSVTSPDASKNRKPQILEINSHPETSPGNRLQEGGLDTLNVSATDPDEDTLYYTWKCDQGSFFEGSTDSSVIWKSPITNADETYRIRVEVSDGELTAKDSILIYVKPLQKNNAPIARFEVSQVAGNTSTIFTFDASKSEDVERGIKNLLYSWDWDGDGEWDIENMALLIYKNRFNTVGFFNTVLRVLDSFNQSDTISKIIRIEENQPPIARFDIIPSTGNIQTIFQFDASLSIDIHNDSLRYSWDWDSDGIWNVENISNPSMPHQFSFPGEYMITLRITDTGGLSGIYQKPVTVESYNGWYAQNSQTSNSFSSVFFTDSHTGWVTSFWGVVLYTEDGGINWKMKNLGGYDERFSCVYFLDENNGWLLSANYPMTSHIRHTNDGGRTWGIRSSPILESLRDMSFIDDQNGWIAADWSKLLITNDGGLNWRADTIGTPGHMDGVYFIHPDTGWAAGMFSNIVYTKDGGRNWTKQNSPVSSTFTKVLFVNSKTGYIIGSAGTILHTIVGVENWTQQSSGTTQALRDILFIESQTGYITGAGDTILYTNDDGQNWIAQSSGTTNSLSSVFFTNYYDGWIVGDNGTILHTINGGFE